MSQRLFRRVTYNESALNEMSANTDNPWYKWEQLRVLKIEFSLLPYRFTRFKIVAVYSLNRSIAYRVTNETFILIRS